MAYGSASPLADLHSLATNHTYGRAPLLLAVSQNRLDDFLRFDTNRELYSDTLPSQTNSPYPTEVDYVLKYEVIWGIWYDGCCLLGKLCRWEFAKYL